MFKIRNMIENFEINLLNNSVIQDHIYLRNSLLSISPPCPVSYKQIVEKRRFIFSALFFARMKCRNFYIVFAKDIDALFKYLYNNMEHSEN